MKNERESCEMIEDSFILSKRIQIETSVKSGSQAMRVKLPRTNQRTKEEKRMLENAETEKMNLTQNDDVV